MSLFTHPVCPSAARSTLGDDFSAEAWLSASFRASRALARLGRGDRAPCTLDPPRATVVDPLSAPGSTWSLGAVADLSGPPLAIEPQCDTGIHKAAIPAGPGGPPEKNPAGKRDSPNPRGIHEAPIILFFRSSTLLLQRCDAPLRLRRFKV